MLPPSLADATKRQSPKLSAKVIRQNACSAALRGMTNKQFAKYGLLQLGRGEDLTRIVKGGQPRRIAPTEDVLALKPELSSKQ